MIVNSTNLHLQEAIEIFYSFNEDLVLNSLSPTYVWLDSFRNSELIPTYWFANHKDYKYLHCFHITNNRKYNISDIESSYGYGGPISNTENQEFLQAVSEEFEFWANKKNIIAEFIRFHPLIQNHCWYTGKISKNRKTIFIDLTKDLYAEYESRRVTDIKRGLERLSFEKVDSNLMLEIFPNLYTENMIDVKASKFYFFCKKYIENLISNSITDNWIIKFKEQVVSATIIIKSEISKTLEYHLSASNILGRKNKASSFMIHIIANYYKKEGYSTLYLGGGRTEEENDSLLFFKKGFSKNIKDFYIGHKIFNSEKYSEIKLLNKKTFNKNKILFYKED